MKKKILQKELQELMNSNGDLRPAVDRFKERYPGSELHEEIVSFTLDNLINLASPKGSLESGMSESEISQFLTANLILLDILGAMGASGVYDGIMKYSRNLRMIPGAMQNGELNKWAKDLLIRAGYILVVCREREYSNNPPY